MQNCLQKIRTERGLSRAVLAAAISVSYETVYRWECHLMDISGESLLKLSSYFQIPPSDIVPAMGKIASGETLRV